MKKFSLKDKKIWIAGHNGMVGQTILRKLRKDHDKYPSSKIKSIITEFSRKMDEKNKPEVIFLTAS